MQAQTDQPAASKSAGSASREKLGVVLFQLGGPDSLDAVEPFLHNLFLDPDIIDFPFAKLARPVLAKLMAASRAKQVRQSYAKLGGKSPLVEWTRRQACALEQVLRESLDARVVVAMRYWHPFTSEAIGQLVRERVSKLVLLPLYPHYSKTTTGSSLNEWRRRVTGSPLARIPTAVIENYHDDPGYLDTLVDQIECCLQKFPAGESVHLLFSAHGVPTNVIAAGDPYQRQIEETTRLVLGRGQWRHAHTVCYQSKVGSGRWLQPSIHEVIPQLAARGQRRVLVVPISFVSDHIETLHEIGVEVREQAQQTGFLQFEMMPGLNDGARFIRALADLVCERVPAAVVS